MLSSLLAVAVVQGSVAMAAPTGFERITIRPATSRIDIDGRLNEPAWQGAAIIALPYEIRPRENAEARVPTECRATFDSQALYVGCVATDDPRALRAWFTDRDGIGAHDRIVLFIDPFADSRRAFFFNVNPLGVQQDGIFNGLDGSADLAWDAVWESAGRLTDRGYNVEMAIPFRSIPFPEDRPERMWRFFIERNWPRTESVVFRSTRLDHSNQCNLCQADELAGLTGLAPGLGLHVNPTVTALRTDRRDPFPSGPLSRGTIEPETGVTGRLSITQDLTANATVNPDFSQVEADVAQLDVNERFSLFFPEKRPFFLDGTEVFATPIQAAFTRTIADPSVGGSVTGKVGPVLAASLVARDELTTVLVPGNQRSTTATLDRRSWAVFQRVRTDIGSTAAAGALYTGRLSGEYRNHVFGADGFVRLTPLARLHAQVLQSLTTDPEEIRDLTGRTAGVSEGTAAEIRVQQSDFSSRTPWFGTLEVLVKSPAFRADAGFEPQVDVRRIEGDVAWNIWSEGATWFTRLNFWAGAHRSETFRGRLNSEDAWVWFSYQGPRQTFAWVWPRWGRQHFAGRTFRFNWSEASVSGQPADNVDLGVQLRWGDDIDFANARGGSSLRFTPTLQVRLGRHLDIDLRHRIERLSVNGQRLFTAHLAQSRVVYNFTARALMRTIVQYRHTARNPSQYLDPVDRTSTGLFTQLLFSYRLNARTGVFLGIADNRAGREPENDPRVALTPSDRTFFVKLSYALSR